MGRPVNKKYFGNPNLAATGEAVGGEGFSSLVVTNSGSTTYYSTTTAVTWAASTPQIAGGEAASGTATVNGSGEVTALVITNSGSGYTSTSSVTVTLTPATTGTAVTYDVYLTSSRTNALAAYARVSSGGSGLLADIVKQEASRRYLVKTADGQGQCKLVAVATGSLAAGEMNLIATDANGSTYYVTKLTNRRATLTRQNIGSSWVFATGDVAGWTTAAASGTIVSLANN